MLQAESQKLSGNDKQVWYGLFMKRLALAHFIEFVKTGYNWLRQRSWEILPSKRTNEHKLSHLRGSEGSDAAVFAAQFADALKAVKQMENEETVLINFREIKVKCGVA